MAPEHPGRGSDLEFDPACQHVDTRGFQVVPAEHRRVGVETLKVSADGHRLAEKCAVIEFQRWQLTQGIAREVFRLLDVAGHDADFVQRNGDALLRQEDPHAARIGGGHRRVVEFHVLVRSSAKAGLGLHQSLSSAMFSSVPQALQ